MAKQTVNVGTTPNARDGDPLRNAFTKINQNFDELYAGNFADPEAIGSALKPDTDATYDLGASDKQWADLYVRDFIYLNGVRLEGANGNLLVEGATITADSQGSVFGDDSTLLVDGVNNVINLNGTISTHIIPTTTETYDLGSASNRFRDLYLSGSTIDLGGTTLSVVGGELQLGGVKIPTQTDLDTAVNTPTGDVVGSVFADDSTVLVDGVNGKIVGDIENTSINTSNIISTGDIIIQNGNDIVTLGSEFGATFQLPNKGVSFLGGGVDGGTYNIAFTNGGFGSILTTNSMNILSGDSITIGTANGLSINNTVTVDNTVTAPSFVGDLTGSVFADDSTLLVDGINGKLIGDVVTTSITNSRDIDIASEDDVAIITSAGDSNHEWFFNSGGYLSFPPNGELLFDGDAGITFSTVYDVAGSTAHIDIRDTGSTANLSIDNDAANGTIDITANGYVTIATDDDGTRYEFNFGVDGSLTLPGAVVTTPDTSTGGVNSGTATALDVTKTLQVLNSEDPMDDFWTLADGTEGQIMHFVPGSGAGSNQHYVEIANWRRWDSDTSSWIVEQDLTWTPFKLDFDGTRWTGVATAIFTNGAWQTSSPWID
jgi:hypothetical protein